MAEERNGDYFGPALNRVARLLAAGHGGQVLLSRVTAELVHDHLPEAVALCDLGDHRLKDLTRPEHIFQLISPDLPTDFPPLNTLTRYTTNLPVQPTPLIGREREITAVLDLLRRSDVRLLTLTGAPGIGKTRVSLQVAADLLELFNDGVFLVTLSAISDPALVPMAIASILGARDLDRRTMLEQLVDTLRSKQLLLLLDNFEHVRDARSVIAALLAAVSDLKLLITSRTPLRISGEHEYAVPPLALPDPDHGSHLEIAAQTPAIALFTTRARAVKPDFALTATNAPSVAAICARLDGLPLAIELAAARCKLFPPQTLLKRLEHRFAVLTGGPHDLPARQRTLHGAITWSYDLLAPAEQQLFTRLAVFSGGCTLQAAAAVCGATIEHDVPVLEGIAALLDQSLIRQEVGTDGEPRVTMLETIRAYALEQLTTDPDAEAIYRRHATFFLGSAEAAEQLLRSGDQMGGVAQLKQEHDNLQAAIGWAIAHGEAEIALRLTGALGWFWDMHGHLSEGRAWLTQALALASAAPPAARARALASAGMLAADHNDVARAQNFLAEALTLYRLVGNTAAVAYTLCSLGRVQRFRGDYAAAQAHFAEGLALAQQIGDGRTVAYASYNLGRIMYQRGDYDAAQALFTDSLAHFREARDTWGAALAHCNLGRVAYQRGDDIAAEIQLSEGLTCFSAIGDVWGIALALCKRGWVALRRGDHAAAQTYFTESLSHAHKVGYHEGLADALSGLAAVVGTQGAWVQAAQLLGAAGGILDAIREPLNTLDRNDVEQVMAAVRAQLGEAAYAAAWSEGQSMPPDNLLHIQPKDYSKEMNGKG